ncbi:predicted protein [Phaeodactylum tricornutum CCAP 1055/1]|jgi:Skp family chaperone for outer membrane proteins|uniref:Uncharacterized protein n=1 Tax=Phaeodactylum tricornutum (strain CCAP 1055/1) TaxID=556484 RepID=B5Y3N8_PHATC|nr:predicted protein [Phaeodactylum tricornutum CCAP 1055/1]ACI65340.1 predicted protein [Phaeodactylum tricornutum CCAP 1055/1]|eukprot:XP_002185870.1 predicted protein [Phaeodactylum tricornutum CCAP 1055/1]
MSAVEMTKPAETMGDVETGQGGVGGPLNLPPNPETGKGFLKPIPETTPMEKTMGIVGGACVVTALAAMIVEQSTIVILGGILSSIVGPYAYWQQTRLTDIKALKETHAAIQEEVDRFSDENHRLSSNIDHLTGSVNNLKDVEDALQILTQQQGKSVNAFAKQVQENKSILAQMQTNLKANVLQNLLSVILRSDTDQDMKISEAEVSDLTRRINNMAGVRVHENRFRNAIQNKSVADVMEVVKNLLNDNIPDSERIFELSQ